MDAATWSIRPFRPEDQEAIKEIYRYTVKANPLLYYRPLSGPQLPDNISQNFAHPNDAFYVAESEGRIVGFCGVRTQTENRTVASLVNGTVVPEFRGRGIYQALFRVREEDAINKGIKKLLAITSHHNTKMRDHLLREGFEIYEPESPIAGFYHLRKVIG